MNTTVLIGIVVLVILIAVVAAALVMRQRQQLRTQFGPEYDRVVEDTGSRREAEAELRARQRRRQSLELRDLEPASHQRYTREWQSVQARFVDDPKGAVQGADALITAVMAERGYPMTDFEQRSADLSVDYPEVVQNYRAGHAIQEASAAGRASTEDYRDAMVRFRSLFEQLVGRGSSEPVDRNEPGRAGGREEVR